MATYTVKSGGGGNYTTIQACANAVVPGDTCTIYAGTYAEFVTVPAAGAGTAVNRVTFNVNSGDAVTVKGFNLRSYNTLDTTGMTITDTAFGSTVCIAVASGDTRTGIWVIGTGTITECGSAHGIRASNSGVCQSCIFRDFTISWVNNIAAGPAQSGGPAFSLYAHDTLFDNVTMTHVNDCFLVGGQRNVFRNTTCGPLESDDFTLAHHVDFTQVNCTGVGPTSTDWLLENNTIQDIAINDGHFTLWQNQGCSSPQRFIIRYNTINNLGSLYLIANTGATPFIKHYNNTVVRTQSVATIQDIIASYLAGCTGGSFINELWYDAFGNLNNVRGYQVSADSETGFVAKNFLVYDPDGSRTWAAPLGTSSGLIQNQNPNFVNSASDFHLQAGSPALNAGTSLTTVATADTGSGTTLIVDDSTFFQCLSNVVNCDTIAVGTVGNTALISSIDHATNTITLAAGISRNDGDAVWLYKDSSGTVKLTGSAPDIGAFGAAASGCVASLSQTALTAPWTSGVRPGFAGQSIPLTLTNIGTSSCTISSIAINSTNPPLFTQTNDCGGTLAASATCTITVTFTPNTAGAVTQHTLTVDMAAGTDATCTLDGTGVTINNSPLRAFL